MKEDLGHLEQEVELARARLTNNLSTLLSAGTYFAFKKDLKEEARSGLSRIVEDVKGRAAANPAAALAIGAGLMWRLLQRPPISAALIGAGLVSLLRTTPIARDGFSDRDFYEAGKERLKQQASYLAGTVKHQAVEIAGDISEQASELADVTSEKFVDAVADVKDQAASITRRAARSVDDGWRSAAHVSVVNDPNVRDKMLLGLAGVAVAAALGIAYQRNDGANPLG